jgi:hypothetical protein
MKSKITIDVDQDNTPIIKVEYIPSEDVRDKLVKKFLEAFGSYSCWAHTFFIHNENAPVVNNTMIVRPISSDDLKEQAEGMINNSKYVHDSKPMVTVSDMSALSKINP